MDEAERLSHYDERYFTGRNIAEINAFKQGYLRLDMLSAYCYAHGFKSYSQVLEMLEPWIDPTGMKWKDFKEVGQQVIMANGDRLPSLILDIGCGRGEFVAMCIVSGVSCIGIDPSPGSKTLYLKTLRKWAGKRQHPFVNEGIYDGLVRIQDISIARPDTIVLCEAMEHIPSDEFWCAWEVVKEMLARNRGLFIATNHIGFYPIPRDNTGYDHVTPINNRVYNVLCDDAKEVVFRQGSHLVLRM